jgi:hypothetical protein
VTAAFHADKNSPSPLDLLDALAAQQVLRHVAERAQYGRLRFRIADTDERNRPGMAEDLPKTFRALDCRRRAGTFERLAGDETMVGQIEWHGDEVSDLAHGRLPDLFLLPV